MNSPIAPLATSDDLVRTSSDQPRIPHALEYLGVIGFFSLGVLLLGRLVAAPRSGSIGWLVVAALGGYVVSDLISGLVHWGFDTWGSPDTPLVGKSFIIPFRVHHSDPKDITRHGFVATNGHNCLVSTAPILGAFFVPLDTAWGGPVLLFVASLCLGVFATNQFHKWAHADRVGPVVQWLQQWHLVLGPEHHSFHHAHPYDRNYCITSGWLNAPLGAIGFFRGLERLITALTGVEPRKDDLRPGARPTMT